MRLDEVRELLEHQADVIARRQLVAAGATAADLRRWLRRRELVQLHPGVYIAHTGPPAWLTRAWAAVQVCWPAALSHGSAVAPGGAPIHVAVSPERKPVCRDGIVVHRLQDLEERVRWNLSPPRLRLEDALLLQAAQVDRTNALALLQTPVGVGGPRRSVCWPSSKGLPRPHTEGGSGLRSRRRPPGRTRCSSGGICDAWSGRTVCPGG